MPQPAGSTSLRRATAAASAEPRWLVLFHQIPPVAHALLSVFQKTPVLVAFEMRDKNFQRFAAIGDETDFHWVSEPDPHRVELDLNGSSLAWLGQEFDVGKRCSYHE